MTYSVIRRPPLSQSRVEATLPVATSMMLVVGERTSKIMCVWSSTEMQDVKTATQVPTSHTLISVLVEATIHAC